jgi:ribonuclease HI
MIEVYCDGSCPQSGGVGGWAFAILLADEHLFCSGYEEVATNNTMELRAALMALREIRARELRKMPLKIITDSMYVVQGMNSWRHNWSLNDFASIKNPGLWRRLHKHGQRCDDLRFEWVKGHAGNYWNEYVDKMAGKAQKAGLIHYATRRNENV